MPEFRSLASLLRPEEPAVAVAASADEPEPAAIAVPEEEALREARLFRAHLREALDRALEELLERIAREVFARELVLAHGEIADLVNRMLARFMQSEPLRVRVHPDDVAKLEHCDVAVFADETLERGDAYIDLRNGTLDLSLTARLESVVAELQGV